MNKKPTIKQLQQMQKKMRKMGAFSKYCSECGQTFGCDDINKFLEMMKNHNCKEETKK